MQGSAGRERSTFALAGGVLLVMLIASGCVGIASQDVETLDDLEVELRPTPAQWGRMRLGLIGGHDMTDGFDPLGSTDFFDPVKSIIRSSILSDPMYCDPDDPEDHCE